MCPHFRVLVQHSYAHILTYFYVNQKEIVWYRFNAENSLKPSVIIEVQRTRFYQDRLHVSGGTRWRCTTNRKVVGSITGRTVAGVYSASNRNDYSNISWEVGVKAVGA
jgi:hypothetical protein